jgi:hypothetical protein
MNTFISIGSWKLLRCYRNFLMGNRRAIHLLTQVNFGIYAELVHFRLQFETHSLWPFFLSYVNKDHNCSSFMVITTFPWLLIFVMIFSKSLVVHSVTASFPCMPGIMYSFMYWMNIKFIQYASVLHVVQCSVLQTFQNSINIYPSFFSPHITSVCELLWLLCPSYIFYDILMHFNGFCLIYITFYLLLTHTLLSNNSKAHITTLFKTHIIITAQLRHRSSKCSPSAKFKKK